MNCFNHLILTSLITFSAMPLLASDQGLEGGAPQKIDLIAVVNDRAHWDRDKNFCFTKEAHSQKCYNLTSMPEYKIIFEGKFTQEWTESFTNGEKTNLLKYFNQLYARYHFVDNPEGLNQSFVVHFIYNGMTLFVFGNLKRANDGSIEAFDVNEFDDSKEIEKIGRKIVISLSDTDKITGQLVNLIIKKALKRFYSQESREGPVIFQKH